MIEILGLIFLFSPVTWELVDDKKGDKHPNFDWTIRGAIMLVSSVIASIITHRNFPSSFFLSFGIFTFFFPYLYNIFNKKKPWYDYLSKTAIPDKWKLWSGSPWYARMFILLIILGAAITVYFWNDLLPWMYPYGR